MGRVSIIIPLFLFLTGCAGLIHSNVTVFHELEGSSPGPTYATLPLQGQEGSLEHKAYDLILKQELNAKGFREVPVDKAEVVVVMLYGIDTGREVVSSIPVFGQTGVSSSSTTGTAHRYGSYGTYSARTTYTPTYGIVGAAPVSSDEYTRFLKLDIYDKKALMTQKVKKIYEAKVVSSGSSSQISEILPTMMKALFEEFPGKSGSTRKSIRPPE